MSNFDELREDIGLLAQALTHAAAAGCPDAVDHCQKDEKGWDGCDACWEAWLRMEAQL